MTADLFGDEPSAPFGTLVELDRTIDRDRPCHDNLAIVRPGKAQHAAELRCATCDAHRGWLPRQALDFLIQTAARFGAPTTPILRDSTIGDMTMTKQSKQFDNTNSGALFKNDRKEEAKHPDYQGALNVEGREFWLSAWIKEAKTGRKYMALALKPKDAAAAAELNDSVPF